MFLGDSGTELEPIFLRRGRRFKYGKRQKTLFGKGISSTEQEQEGYDFASYLDEGSCDEEDEYHSISEGDEDSKESTESLEQ